jgi:hypothetical protein
LPASQTNNTAEVTLSSADKGKVADIDNDEDPDFFNVSPADPENEPRKFQIPVLHKEVNSQKHSCR